MRTDAHFISVQQVSLRGSLARDYLRKLTEYGIKQKDLDDYVFHLAMSNDPSLIKFNEQGVTVIGKRSELGCFPPDW